MKRTSLTVMAWRNLWRNRRRTLLTLSSIAFGVFLAVMFTALQDRNWADMIEMAARLGGGHVSLEHREYQDAPSLSRTVQFSPALTDSVRQQAKVRRVAERIIGQVMVNTARESFGAGFVAFDPLAEDTSTLSVIEGLVEGEMFPSSGDGGIILGQRLAQNLGVELGDKIVYTATDRSGEIVSGLARLSGIVRTGAPSVDAGLALLPIDAARDVLDYAPDESSQLAVFIDDQRATDDVARTLQGVVGGRMAAVPWHVAHRELAAFIAVKVGGARFGELLIAALVAAGIFNTLFVSVMERLREFGVLMAIGFSPGRLFRLVMLESLWLGIVGLIAAAVITIAPYRYLSTTGIDLSGMMGDQATEIAGVAFASTLRVGIYPESVAIIAVAALVATLLAGLYPAWKAGHVDPVKSIVLV